MVKPVGGDPFSIVSSYPKCGAIDEAACGVEMNLLRVVFFFVAFWPATNHDIPDISSRICNTLEIAEGSGRQISRCAR